MRTDWGSVPIGAVLPFMFDTFAGSTGASITISGLAVTDIEVYKGTSMTQRTSDNGYALLDTDGIDLDGITGIQGFSIDTGDNTDAGFYASGSFYTVVVSAITVDTQTVNFIAGTFRCVTAEGVAGQPKVDTAAIAGSAVSTSSAQLGVNVVNAAGTAWGSGAITAASIADGAIDLATFAADAKALMGVIAFGTAQSVTGTTIRLAAAEGFADDEIIGATVLVRSASTGAGQARVITDYVSATDTATVDTWTVTPTGTITYVVFATPPASATSLPAVNVTQIGGQTASAAGAVTFPNATIASTTGAVGSVTGAVGSVTGAVGSVTATVDANIVSVIGDPVQTNGATDTNWGGAP